MNDIFKKLDMVCDEFNYGYIDIDDQVHLSMDDLFEDKYVLRTASNIIEKKIGCCFDHVEALRYLYELNNITNTKSYFILNENGDKYPHGHTIMLAIIDDSYYWYSPDYDNIYGKNRKYDSLTAALLELRGLFLKTVESKDINIIIYEYSKPLANINCDQFYRHCKNGRVINLE